MRFARLSSSSDHPSAALGALAKEDLDFLQLDFPRPRVVPAVGDAPLMMPGHATGICEAIRALVKPLFLEPEFHVVTSAGWSDAYSCVERMANVLVEGGCGELPVAAVRGSNLEPILDMVVAQGVDLTNVDDGTPWKELRAPVLAADLQIGAGPIAAALAEKARVIVGGCYDVAAPTTAHAVHRHRWAWDDYSRLAAAAVAARAAAWRCWSPAPGGSSPISQPSIVELEESGRLIVTTAGPCTPDALLHGLRGDSAQARSRAASGDVTVKDSSLSAHSLGARQVAVEGAAGAAPDRRWRLDVLYHAGYAAEALLTLSADADSALADYVTDTARDHLQPAGDTTGLLQVDSLQAAGDGGSSWLRLAYQSHSLKACLYFVEQVGELVQHLQPQAHLATGPPRVFAQCGLWPARVPRDAVDIAVETRPAHEWL